MREKTFKRIVAEIGDKVEKVSDLAKPGARLGTLLKIREEAEKRLKTKVFRPGVYSVLVTVEAAVVALASISFIGTLMTGEVPSRAVAALIGLGIVPGGTVLLVTCGVGADEGYSFAYRREKESFVDNKQTVMNAIDAELHKTVDAHPRLLQNDYFRGQLRKISRHFAQCSANPAAKGREVFAEARRSLKK